MNQKTAQNVRRKVCHSPVFYRVFVPNVNLEINIDNSFYFEIFSVKSPWS